MLLPSFFDIIKTYGPLLLSGLTVTLQLSAWGIAVGCVLGIVLALAKIYGGFPLSQVISGYIDVIRGLPALVIILMLFFGVTQLINLDAFTCAALSVIIKTSAYQSMVFIGAIQSVSSGQIMAAEALGFNRLGAITNVVLPQALRFALPAWSNEALIVVKDTSLAYSIGVIELMRRADHIAVGTKQPLIAYGSAAALYYVVCTILAKTVTRIEQKTRIPGFGEK